MLGVVLVSGKARKPKSNNFLHEYFRNEFLDFVKTQQAASIFVRLSKDPIVAVERHSDLDGSVLQDSHVQTSWMARPLGCLEDTGVPAPRPIVLNLKIIKYQHGTNRLCLHKLGMHPFVVGDTKGVGRNRSF
jgi:hypothetical protein